MSKTGLFAVAVALLAGGLLLIVPQLVGRNREAAPIVETKTIRVEKDESFSSDELLTKYTLTERSGKEFNSETLAGKVQVVNFFFTSCPVACPLQTAKVQELDREFGPHGVHFLSITCDPDNDTPAVLSKYAKKYNADPDRWVFLTGEFTYIRKIAGEVYKSPLEKGFHREDFVVVDKWGNVRGGFLWNHPDEITSMKELLTTLLAETEPPPEVAPPAPAEVDADNAGDATPLTEPTDDEAIVSE